LRELNYEGKKMKFSEVYLLMGFLFILATFFVEDTFTHLGLLVLAVSFFIGYAIFSRLDFKSEMLEWRLQQRKFNLIIDLLMTIAFDEKRTGKFLKLNKADSEALKKLNKKGGKKNDKSNN
jgi:hypothetical protein